MHYFGDKMNKYQIDGDDINVYKNININNKNSILLVHGAGMSHSIWLDLAEILINNGFNVVIPDLPAHGNSDGCPIGSISEYSNFISKLIAEFDLPNLSIIGHSMGGLIALDYIAKHDDIKNMVLIGTNPVMPVHPNLLELANSDHKKASEMIIEWSVHSDDNSKMMDKISNSMQISNDKSLYFDLMACKEYSDGIQNSAKIKIPSLIISGEFDKMTPIKFRGKFAENMPHAKLETLSESGHMLMVEKTAELSEKILEFLANY